MILLTGDKPKEACGVFGVFAPGEHAAKLTYYGLYALQHRGQESAGIAVSDGDSVVVFKDLGLVSQVFDENTLSSLQGSLAIGHVRYSTTGSSNWENAQPTYRSAAPSSLALAHNGNLVNTKALAESLGLHPVKDSTRPSTDSDLVTALVAANPEPDLETRLLQTLVRLEGAYCFVMMDENKLFAARDPYGLRPMVLGRLPQGYVVASETCALDIVGATFLREVEPGEFLTIDEEGVRSQRFAPANPSLCIFEFVYFARPDSTLYGKGVYPVRYRMGKRLAQEAPAQADLVMPVPDTGVAAAAGYAAASGIPYGDGLVKNRYVGRTFIEPTQQIRDQGIRSKLNPLSSVIEGKRLVVVDDSIVRGSTTRSLVQMLRDAGAREVHLRISSAPIRWPCFYGIDTANRDELIASRHSPEEIGEFLGADSLHYLSLEGMVEATEVEEEKFCTACFSSKYPIPIPQDVMNSKHLLEITPPPRNSSPADALQSLQHAPASREA